MRRVSQARADGKQVALDGDEHLDELAIESRGRRDTNGGVQLVDVAVSGNARIGFRHTRPVEQARFAGIACFCVNLHLVGIIDSCPQRKERAKTFLPAANEAGSVDSC